MTTETSSSTGIRYWPPAAFLIALAAGAALDWLSFWHIGIPLPRSIERLAGWAGVVSGFAIMLTAIGLFKKAGTETEPWKPVSAFVTEGVYRWTRNPMYLGMALIYLGVAFLRDSVITLVLLAPVIVWLTRNVIEKEEAFMTARFGDDYLAYRTRVGRWF